MAKEKIIDNLCVLAVGRYRKENPAVKVTNGIREGIYNSISGIFEKQGEVAAYNYAKKAKLLA